MNSLQAPLIKEEIEWTPEMQQRFIEAIDAPATKGKFAAFKTKVINIKNRFVAWFKALPTWKKVLLILSVLVALGLLTWLVVYLTAAGSTATGIQGAGFVYAMTDGTATKIGLTGRAPLTRMEEIRRYAPNTSLIGSIKVPNMLQFENLAHNHFAPMKYDNYLGSREWFDIGPRKAMNYLNNLI